MSDLVGWQIWQHPLGDWRIQFSHGHQHFYGSGYPTKDVALWVAAQLATR